MKDRKPKGYWSFEKCKEEALKYETRNEFKKNTGGAFNLIYKNNWSEYVFKHMIKIQPKIKWTKYICELDASKYQTRNDFKKNSKNAYTASCSNGWLDEICVHMKPQGSKYKRCIYAYEFSDKNVYVGLTYNLDKRNKEHLNNITSQVYKHIIDTSSSYNLNKLTEYIVVEEAVKLEEYYVNFYKENNWIILNKIKTGGIGGNNLIWTYDKCKDEALKYNSKCDFSIISGGAYKSAKKNGWLDDICSHMTIKNIKPKGYWTKEKCKEEALKYNTRNDLFINSHSTYDAAYKNGWLDEICEHMLELKKSNGYWTKEKCKEEALKYKTRKEYRNNASYVVAWKYGWLDEICSHLIILNRPYDYWTKEICHEEALKYKSRTEFKNLSYNIYKISIKRNWLNDICLHMKKRGEK